MSICPCGSEKSYQDCCGIFIEGRAVPATPEELMRSRYTAYTRADVDYIAHTMKPPASNHFNLEEAQQWAKRVKWLKLNVLETATHGPQGFVEFVAYFYDEGKQHALHELSEFHLENGCWYYVSGERPKQRPISPEPRLSRNDPCHCGSGKKFKKCCGQ